MGCPKGWTPKYSADRFDVKRWNTMKLKSIAYNLAGGGKEGWVID